MAADEACNVETAVFHRPITHLYIFLNLFPLCLGQGSQTCSIQYSMCILQSNHWKHTW